MANLPKLLHKYIGVAVIINNEGKILIDQRLDQGLMAGLWEFPGGKIEPNETVEECIVREIKEELALDIEVGKHLITIEHNYGKFIVTLIVHYGKYLGGIPQTKQCQQFRWVTLAEIDQFQFPEANTQIIAALKNKLPVFLS
jgi:mutator protein MutT